MTDFPDFGQDFYFSFEEPEVVLKMLFRQRGFVRIADEERRLQDPKYKKGCEVRLMARTESELLQIQHWLIEVGFKPGKPYRNNSRLIQPIYGKDAVEWFRSKE
jgi:hypothetical protein